MRRLLVLSSCFAAILSAFMVFQVMQSIQYDYPLGTNEHLELMVAQSPTSKEQLIDSLTRLVDSYGGCLVKPSTSADSYDSQRDLIYFSSIPPLGSSPVVHDDGTIEWLMPGMSGRLVAARDMGDAPLGGSYTLRTNPSLHDALATWGADNGVIVAWGTSHTYVEQVCNVIATSGLALSWLTMQLLTFALAVTWVILGCRVRAVQQLGGIPARQIHVETIGALMFPLAGGGVAGILVSGFAAAAMLGPSNAILILPVALGACLFGLACLLPLLTFASHLAGTGMELLRLRRPVTVRVRRLCLIVSAFAVVLAMQALPPALTFARLVLLNYAHSSVAQKLKDAIAVSIGNFDYLDTYEGQEEARRVMRGLSRRGGIATSVTLDSEMVIDGEELGDYSQFALVDYGYLKLMGIPLPAESGNSPLREVLFDSLPSPTREFLRVTLPLYLASDLSLEEAYSFYEYRGEGEFACLTQDSGASGEFAACEHPLVIVLKVPIEDMSMSSLVLPLVSTGNVIFTDPNLTKEAFGASAIYPYIRSFDRIADSSLAFGQALLSRALLYLSTVILTLLSIGACALQGASLWAAAHRDEVLLSHTAGFRHRSAYLTPLKGDLASAAPSLIAGIVLCALFSPYSAPGSIAASAGVVTLLFAALSAVAYAITCRKVFMARVLRKD